MDTPKQRCSCGKILPPRRRRYCSQCASRARVLWKRAMRAASRGTRYWLDHWLKATGDVAAARAAYNAYMREYMRRYRRRRQGAASATGLVAAARAAQQHVVP